MNRRHISLLLGGVGLIVWLLSPAWQQRVPVSAPTPPAPTHVQAPPVAKPTVTNIPGIGPIPTDPTELARLKARLKAEVEAAFKGTAFFTNPEESRQADETGEIAWILINAHKSMEMAMEHITKSATEPFPPRILEALEHILKHGTDPQMKLTAATLLYRYDQPSGKEYLLAVLNSPTTDLLTRHAALTLAKGREVAAIPGTVAVFPKLGPPPTTLLLTLGTWNDSDVAALLRQQYQLKPQSWGLALALAQAGDPDAVSHLIQTLATHKSLGYLALTVEATLVKYQGLEGEIWKTHMQEMFKKSPRDGVSTILPAFEVAGPQIGAKSLQEMLASTIPLHEEFLAGMELQAKRVRENDPLAFQWFPKDPPTDFMKGAAQLLGQWGVKEAVPTLEQVLVTVQKDNRADVFLNEALGLALYRLDPEHWRETLLNAGVPTYHVNRIPPLAKLRPIPSEYLPKQVNLKAR
ncbi:hypothetical protein LBMAG56_28070 [Verrucomicrobiota bacterium]|nr:hypothetical protein LBMAG56_28070 [Verrucomicrobiota bacterium]